MIASTLSRVQRLNLPCPYQRLVAGVIALAIDEARAGDPDALEWLQNGATDWLDWLCPDTVMVEDVQAAVLARAQPRPGTAYQLEMEVR